MKRNFPEKGSYKLRIGRFSHHGYVYFITTRCFNKNKIFVDKNAVQVIFECIDWLTSRSYIDLHFCVVMPDHIHLVISLEGSKHLSEVIKSLKQYTSRRIKLILSLSDPVWQEQYYDHVIRKEENIIEIIKYCWYNPVRAGLVTNPNDYPYWKSKHALE